MPPSSPAARTDCIGSKAAAAETRKNSAEALLTEAQARQTSHEGVNLDEELVMMTTYQQAFNATGQAVGGEIRYRAVSGVLGEAGVSQSYDEDQLGGVAAALRISLIP